VSAWGLARVLAELSLRDGLAAQDLGENSLADRSIQRTDEPQPYAAV
jgi:hypothetical protein